MCGFCGFVKFNDKVSEHDDYIIERMNHKLIHRGPDAQDTLLFDNVALGFSRLSIIGLDNGMQPIHNEDGSIVLICNGEIFNYIEIRNELKVKGHIFRTVSDVEVIVHLYEEYQMELWEGQDISIEKIRAAKRRKNIAKTTECTAKLCRHSNVKIKLSPSSIQVHWLTTSKCLKSK